MWWSGFLERNSSVIKVGKAKQVEAVRLRACTTEKIERFHVDLQAEMTSVEQAGGKFCLVASLDEAGEGEEAQRTQLST